MDAILPLKISGGYQDHDLRRAQMLVHSIGHFWSGTAPFRLFILARDEDEQTVRDTIRSSRIEIEVISETALVPCLRASSANGWLKQQVIKLAAHAIVSGDFYLTLDADIVCTKPISDHEFVVDGKALTDWETRASHQHWWDGSTEFLKLAKTPGPLGMSVTPELFSVRIATALEAYLHVLHGPDPFAKLLAAKHAWSEYSLYTLFAEASGLLEKYHHGQDWMQDRKLALRSAHSLWRAHHVDRWTPGNAFRADTPGMFAVCQSNTHLDPEVVWDQLSPFIPGDPFAHTATPVSG